MNFPRQIIGTLLTALILIIMVLTNPKEYQLKEHLKEALKEEAAKQGGILGSINKFLSGPESLLMSLTTERTDLYLFSLYEVEGLDKKDKYIGILGTFMELPE